MREGKLDVCLDCGQVYTSYSEVKRKRVLREHYKGYLYLELCLTDGRFRKNKRGRRLKRMSAWVHRLAYMKKRALEQLATWPADHPSLPLPGSWRELVFDLPPSLDIDHDDTNRQNNRGDNLVLRTHAGNSSRKQMSEAERLEVDAAVAREMAEFMAS